MRRLLLVLLSLPLIAGCQPQTSPAPSTAAASPGGAQETTEQERAAVLASVQSFMDALRMKDTTAMNLHVDSLTRITLLRPAREGGTRVVVMTAAQFIHAVSQPGQPGIDEPIRNPVVHVSGDLAPRLGRVPGPARHHRHALRLRRHAPGPARRTLEAAEHQRHLPADGVRPRVAALTLPDTFHRGNPPQEAAPAR